jgi:serine acetyltransferase
VKALQTTHIHDGVKIGANIHISHDIPADSLVYIDKETAKITVREGYYKK